ncbi:MAG TPA: TolC family protein, partial [Isosphaeraceae bacterium]|nr:TolC family protein [Isosphaeraceae bacterium]
SVEVARRFPTALNPTLWIDYRPITLIPRDPFTVNGSKNTQGPFYHWGQQYLYVSLRQPLELGHQTTHRYHIAKAAFDQYQWNVVQAEYQTMVQTYNLFQTAAYRREKYRLAEQLAAFNERLQGSLKRQVEANLVPTADLILAEIESEATQQQATAARQDYLTALNVLQIQMGVPEASGMVEPLGEFTLPATVPMVDEQQMVETALQCRPAVHAAQAQVRGADAAIRLARGDRIPTPVVGPQYAMDEGGLQYVGLVYITPVPILNSGTPLVRQREAEARRARQALQQTQQQVISEVRSAVAKWNGAVELMKESAGLTSKLSKRVGDLEKLFEAGQTPLANLMQARQRLIQLENAQLDATWQATQAQADLLMALGAPSLLNVL